MKSSERLEHIDGIRGWAALIVLTTHVFGEMFGSFSPAFHPLPAYLFMNGGLAVCVFFILSGDALSASFLRSGSPVSLSRMIAKRYFRLAGPVFVSCMLVYGVMVSGLDFHQRAIAVLNNQDWLGHVLNFEPALLKALRYGACWALIAPDKAISYNPILWSMSVEFFGSLMVFAYLPVAARLKAPMTACLAIFIFFSAMSSYYGLFFLGILFGLMREKGLFGHPRVKSAGPVSILAGFGLAYGLQILHREETLPASILIAAALTFGFYATASWRSFFAGGLSKYLGKISFPLYLVHFPLLISFTAFGAVWLSGRDQLTVANAFLLASATALGAVALADLFSRIEQRYLRFMNKEIDRLLS